MKLACYKRQTKQHRFQNVILPGEEKSCLDCMRFYAPHTALKQKKTIITHQISNYFYLFSGSSWVYEDSLFGCSAAESQACGRHSKELRHSDAIAQFYIYVSRFVNFLLRPSRMQP